MKNIIIFVWMMSIIANCYGQTTKSSDESLISIKPVIGKQTENFPEIAKRQLENKLLQLITKNGVSSLQLTNQFILTTSIDVLTKDVISGTRPAISLNLAVTFYIIDYESKNIYSSTYIETGSVGSTETKAYINAIKKISPRKKELVEFIETGKQKIIAYYEKQCDKIIREAQTFAKYKNYEGAIFKLCAIPDVCTECHKKAWDELDKIYQKYIDEQCQKRLSNARMLWAANQNYKGALQAAEQLSYIEPDADCYSEAQKLVVEMKKKVRKDEDREWDFEMKKFDAVVNTEQQRIKAIRDVGVAYGQGQPDVDYNLKEIYR